MSKCSQPAHSAIDTRREFKLIPYSGDDEQWPQWVLKFEAWSEHVGLGTTTGLRVTVYASNRDHDVSG